MVIRQPPHLIRRQPTARPRRRPRLMLGKIHRIIIIVLIRHPVVGGAIPKAELGVARMHPRQRLDDLQPRILAVFVFLIGVIVFFADDVLLAGVGETLDRPRRAGQLIFCQRIPQRSVMRLRPRVFQPRPIAAQGAIGAEYAPAACATTAAAAAAAASRAEQEKRDNPHTASHLNPFLAITED